MGYTTDFEGQVLIDPPLNAEEIEFLTKFSGTRRMNRKNGPYFVDGTGMAGQGDDPDILDFNNPPAGQPGLWCGWVPTTDGTAIEWDGKEKFYHSAQWMNYLITHFIGFTPYCTFPFLHGHKCNGIITAQDEDPADMWQLIVTDNVVKDGVAICQST